jgi:hypothetical protein
MFENMVLGLEGVKQQEGGENSIISGFVSCTYSSPTVIRIIRPRRKYATRIGEGYIQDFDRKI